MTQDNVPQPPEKEFRAGKGLSAAIWSREEQLPDDHTIRRYSIKIQKRYRDAESGQWLDSSTFFPDELPRLRLLIDKAFEYVALKENEPSSAAA